MVAFQSRRFMVEQDLMEEVVLRHVGRRVPFEHDLGRRGNKMALLGQLLDPGQVLFAAVIVDPDDLEEIIALDQAVGSVVDRLARPRQ